MTKYPSEAKAIGRQIKHWNKKKWENERGNIVKRALELKILNNSTLKYMLLKLWGKTIAEASPFDKVWGIGFAETDERAYYPEVWTGKNLLGQAWMQLRDSILDDYSIVS